jgi:hypothetical protein
MRAVSFDPRSGSAPTKPSPVRPGPAQPGPTRPWRPPTPHAPPPLLPLSSGFPAQQPPSPSSTSLSLWCPRDWKQRSPEFGPQGELPFPSPLSPSPSSSPPARALSFPCTRAPLPSLFAGGAAPPCPPCSPAARPRPPLPPLSTAVRPCSPGARDPAPCSPGAAPVWPRRGLRPGTTPGVASAPCARRPASRRGSRGLGVASRSPVHH